MGEISSLDKKILELLSDGWTNKGIAGHTGKKKRYIEKRIAALKKKYNCQNQTQLACMYIAGVKIH